MKAFLILLKTESKLVLRGMDSVFFGIVFPLILAVVLGVIYGIKPAYEGADFTSLQQSFGELLQ